MSRRFLIVAILWLLSAAAHGATPLGEDATGLWWSSTTAGRGVNVVQQGNTLFATFFIYDADGKAHWYVAPDLQAPSWATSSDTDIRYSGDLYESGGPALSDAFNPAQVVLRKVGTARFQHFQHAGANLKFTIDGKEDDWWIGQQTWAANNISGKYMLKRVERDAPVCGSTPTHLVDLNDAVVTHSGNDVTIETSHGTPSIFSCTYKGSYSQRGRLAVVAGDYSCTDGTSGPFTISDLEMSPTGMLGRFSAMVKGCGVLGHIGGPRETVSSQPAEITDLWWNPGESGWGVNLMQQGGVLFATFFVYGADRKAHWYVASDMRGNGTRFSGDLFETSGPGFTASFGTFDASKVTRRRVGTATFEYSPPESGTLTYSVDGVTVSKAVTRQTWKANDVAGRYEFNHIEQGVGCFPLLSIGSFGETDVTVAGSAVTITSHAVANCTYTGNYAQAGHLGSITGNFSCFGHSGTFRMSEVQVSPAGFLARITQTAEGCTTVGNIGGVRRAVPLG